MGWTSQRFYSNRLTDIKDEIRNEFSTYENGQDGRKLLGFSFFLGEAITCLQNPNGDIFVNITLWRVSDGWLSTKHMDHSMYPYNSNLCPQKYLKLINTSNETSHGKRWIQDQWRKHYKKRIVSRAKIGEILFCEEGVSFGSIGKFNYFKKTGRNRYMPMYKIEASQPFMKPEFKTLISCAKDVPALAEVDYSVKFRESTPLSKTFYPVPRHLDIREAEKDY